MKHTLVKAGYFNAGSREVVDKETKLENIEFNVFKFNSRPVPEKKEDKLILCCMSEFGCEIVGCMYSAPYYLKQNPGKYSIAVGWYGRAYLYKHLVDEFWEIKEEHQWLRNYCRAFHHESKNLSNLEKRLKDHGTVVNCSRMGAVAIANFCHDCNHQWTGYKNAAADVCPKCNSKNVKGCLFSDVKKYKQEHTKIPNPSKEKIAQAAKILKPNSIGIFARGRKCYGRNLQPEFYVKLISLLESKGYNPIWLGEKETTQECPVKHIVDFSRMEESRDLELTLAIISQVKFTIQFWTASTRLAGILGVPYILFESPDQIYGQGQEGLRRSLCDVGPSKLVVAHYKSVYENHEQSLKVVDEAVAEVERNDFSVKIGEGLVESEQVIQGMINASS